ncbi:MAG: hypothetical protein JWR63_4613 [Conexibacter sp.]|nr:hypothetical protein [Conexibacter sp.]
MSVAEHPTHPPRLEAAHRPRARSWLPVLERVALLALPLLTILLIASPMLRTPHAWFAGDDWQTHLWYLWHQSDTLRHTGMPSFFVNYAEGSFYPHFAFYGGTLNVIAGAMSAVVGGNGLPTYIAWWMLAIASSYGGFYWLGRMAGLGRWTAQVPSLVFVTSTYYITLIYARGDWPEFVAASSMPLAAAASISVVRAEQRRFWPTAALAISVILFSGSHNISLLYGGIFLVVLLTALVVAVPAARRMITRAAALRWLGIAVPAFLANAWFLVPLGAYQHLTRIGDNGGDSTFMLHLGAPLVRPQALFTLERASGIEPARQFAMALPVLAMAWVLITLAVVLVRRAGSPTWRRTLLAVVLVTGSLLAVMMDVGLLLALPEKARLIQFNYRLENYVLMGIAGALLAALVLMRGSSWRGARLWTLTLVPIVVFSLIATGRQVNNHPLGYQTDPFNIAIFPTIGDFADGTTPELSATDLPRVDFPPGAIHHDRVSLTVSGSPGQYLGTNLLTIAPLVHIENAKIVGAQTVESRVSNATLRQAILQIDEDVKPGPVTISIRPAHPFPVVAGRVLTLIGLLGLAANFVAIGVGFRRRRRLGVAR